MPKFLEAAVWTEIGITKDHTAIQFASIDHERTRT